MLTLCARDLAALTHLTLLNSSFRPHSHTAPATLAPFLGSLTHLTMANVGLPHPSSHMTDMLRCCAPTLRYLAISSLRDIDAGEFRRAFEVLIERGNALETLVVGFLTEQQVSALQTATSAQTSGNNAPFNAADSEQEARPLLSRLPVLANLTFTLPLPTLPLLLALPPSLRKLTIRPPYARPSGTSVREHSRSSLLSVLSRTTGSTTSTTTTGQATPTTPSTLGRGEGADGGIRRMSVTLEQLEEEEAAVVAIEEALAQGAGLGLEEIRWECKALRSARGRIELALERRKERRAVRQNATSNL